MDSREQLAPLVDYIRRIKARGFVEVRFTMTGNEFKAVAVRPDGATVVVQDDVDMANAIIQLDEQTAANPAVEPGA